MAKPKTSTKARRRRQQRQQRAAQQPDSELGIAQALQFQRQGEYEQAKEIYVRVLRQDPTCVDAWHLMGMALSASEQHEQAIECLHQALTLLPGQPEILGNLGVALRAAGDLEAAESALRQALSVTPSNTSHLTNLGTVLLERGQLRAAAEMFQQVLQQQPRHRLAMMNLANAWQLQGRARDAAGVYESILQDAPNDALVLANLGEALRQQGHWERAAAHFQRALEIDPQLAETQLNLARTWMNLHDYPTAEQLLQDLIGRRTEWAKPLHYLGKSYLDQRQLPQAIDAVQRSLAIDPSDQHAHSTLGFSYLESGQPALAIECFRQAIATDPTMHSAHSSLLFIQCGDANIDQDELFAAHCRWGEQHGQVEPLEIPPRNRTDNRIRIGYVSPDLRDHAVARFFEPTLKAHDRTQFEVYCYAEVPLPDATTARLRHSADHWRSTIGLSDRQVAEQILHDEIDIAVDLAGHTANNRLKALAFRPAPVQMTWLGYPNTTGLPTIDYRISCDVQNPTDEATQHTEQLLRLPVGSFCFAPPENAPDVAPSPAAKGQPITFGSLHRPFKITDVVCRLWSDVLHAIPSARLILFNTRFNEQSKRRVLESFGDRGIDLSRIEVRHQANERGYLDCYRDIDISLDVTPWAGGTTTLESLWMGVPVVAFYGDRRAARSTAAIMHQVDMKDWVANTFDDYVRLAMEKAGNIERLIELRADLRGIMRDTIANAERFTQHLESAYRDAASD